MNHGTLSRTLALAAVYLLLMLFLRPGKISFRDLRKT